MNLLGKATIAFVVSATCCSAVKASVLVGQGNLGTNVYQIWAYQGGDDKNWLPADTAAQGLSVNGVSGHLATITSAGEDAFINGLGAAAGLNELWVGGFQPAGSGEPGDGWTWVNGEGGFPGNNAGPVYANWLGGEPNNVGAGEQFLAVRLGGAFGWNDEGNLANIVGYVVEFDGAVPEPSTIVVWGLLACTFLGSTWWQRRNRN